METVESCVPPGFRFHPTEEELVGYYLSRKVSSQKIDLEVITDVDLYRIEPWDLQDRCKLGYEEQKEWYFFSHKDKKHPTGTRTNRATTAGFWKATGRDKAVLSKSRVIGRRKTLVFYVGRAPNGRRTDWIMHEYRLQSSECETPQEEGWVVCRAFKKQIPNPRPSFSICSPNYDIRDDHLQFGPEAPADHQVTRATDFSNFGRNLDELKSKQTGGHVFEIPRLLENSSLSTSTMASKECFESYVNVGDWDCGEQFVDWKVLDKLLASQLMSESAASCSSSGVRAISPKDCDADAQNQRFS